MLLGFYIAFFSLWSVSYSKTSLGNSWNLQDRFTNLAAVLQFTIIHNWRNTKLGDNSTNFDILIETSRQKGKIRSILKNVTNNLDKSPKRIHTLPAVLREENRKSPRTAAHICKSISEIPGISKFFGFKRFKTWQPKIEGVTEKFKNQKRFFF